MPITKTRSARLTAEDAVKYAKASIKAEGFDLKAPQEQLITQHLKGAISRDEMLKRFYQGLLEKHKKQ